MALSPFLPSPVGTPTDPLAQPNTPAAPAPPGYQNTPAGRAAYLQKFAQNPWFNQPLFDNYLQSHPDWVDNTPYWDKRLGDAPGTGSNLPEPKKPTSPYGMPDLTAGGPPQSDMLAQIMEELQAQQRGAESPRARQMQMSLLQGGQ